MYRSTDYADDLMDANPSIPATDPIFLGTAFKQQTEYGPTFNDIGDDRVTFIGDADDPTVQHMRAQALPAAMDGVGPNVFEQSPNPERESNPPDTTVPGGAIQQVEGSWYWSLRPHAGYQLPLAPDDVYVTITGDAATAEAYGATDPLLQTPGERLIMERALDIPSRLSMQPSSEQEINLTWDDTMGSQEWSGDKQAMERIIADSGPWYNQSIPNSIPSPTGAGGAFTDPFAYDLFPQPLTFRSPPTPWDQGENHNNGYYVDSGY